MEPNRIPGIKENELGYQLVCSVTTKNRVAKTDHVVEENLSQ